MHIVLVGDFNVSLLDMCGDKLPHPLIFRDLYLQFFYFKRKYATQMISLNEI